MNRWLIFGIIICEIVFTKPYCIWFQSKFSNRFQRLNKIYANPVPADGNNYRGQITEKEAFQWFDEAYIYVRAGSGGPGANTFKFGKARQHVAPSGLMISQCLLQ